MKNSGNMYSTDTKLLSAQRKLFINLLIKNEKTVRKTN